MSNLNRHPVRRAAAGVLATTLTFTGAAIAAGVTPANALAGFNFERLAGFDRYETAAAIALGDSTLRSASTVVLASGGERNFPDALTANYLAGDVRGPILLTDPVRLPAATRSALTSIAPTRVVIVGGTSAVSASVESQVRALGYIVSRLGGLDRYDTARAVAFSVNDRNRDGVQNNGSDTATVGLDREGRRTAVLGNGQDFADILAAGPLGYARNFPIAITRPAALAAQTRAVLTDLNVDRVIIVGGTTAVSQAVEDQVRVLNGGTEVLRLAGQLRFETATKIAAFSYDELAFDKRHINLARSDKFADSLSGGPHAGQERAPIVLSTPEALTPITRDFIQSRACTLVNGHIFGGTAAISAATEAAAVAAARDARNCGPGAATPTTTISVTPFGAQSLTGAPELQSVVISSTDPTVVTFSYDEAIPGQALNFFGDAPNRTYPDFRLYLPTGTALFPFEARIDGSTVIARFRDGVQVRTATLGTSRYGAVEDAQGIGSIEGEFPLAATVVRAATAQPFRPDLVDVRNFRLAGTIAAGQQQVLVDYIFNGNPVFAPTPTVGDGNPFSLVGTNSQLFTGQEVTAKTPNADGTFTVTVQFATDLTNVPESQLRRGFVRYPVGTGAVILSDDYENTGGVTVDPDLVNTQTASTSPGAYVVRYQFDEAVSDTGLNRLQFILYSASGETVEASAVVRSAATADGATVVLATFNVGRGTVATTDDLVPVGAFLENSAVRATDNTASANGGFNRPDQRELTLPAAAADTVRAAGLTDLPDLTAVDVERNVVTQNRSVAFVFDAPCGSYVNGVAYDLYDASGTQFRVLGSNAGINVAGSGATAANSGSTCRVTFSIDNGFSGLSNEQIAAAVTGGVESFTNEVVTTNPGTTGTTTSVAQPLVTEVQHAVS